MSLFQGMDGERGRINQKVLNKIQGQAARVGLDLNSLMGQNCVYRQKGDTFFVVFYNQARATGCSRDYLIQRVVLEKDIYKGGQAQTSREYLVEVVKINNAGMYKRADEHYKVYGLAGAERRYTKVQLELGCGEIPGVAQGQAWPFDRGILYKRVQDYSTSPGLYNQVRFDFSSTYTFDYEFDTNGRPRVNAPGYSCQAF